MNAGFNNLTTPFKSMALAYLSHALVAKLGFADADASYVADAAWMLLGGLAAYVLPADFGSGIATRALAWILKVRFAWIVVALGLSAPLVGCSARAGHTIPAPLARDCQLTQILVDGFMPLLEAKCAKAEDPLLDRYCIAALSARIGVDACFVAAADGDATGVKNALDNLRKTQDLAR